MTFKAKKKPYAVGRVFLYLHRCVQWIKSFTRSTIDQISKLLRYACVKKQGLPLFGQQCLGYIQEVPMIQKSW